MISDMKGDIGRISSERPFSMGIADANISENGDGYLSDVQTNNSNNASEVSQDIYTSTRLIEQHFKDKYRFLRDAYEQRIRQLTEVVNNTCENLFSDELLIEMKSDKTSSAFIPAHLGELIDKHLEGDREKFIHEIITQLCSVKVELLNCQETIILKNITIGKLESEVIRGRKAESAIGNIQKKSLELRRQFDDISSHSEESMRTLQAKYDLLNNHDNLLKEQAEKNLIDLSIKTQELEALKVNHEARIRDFIVMESSFELTLDQEVRKKLAPLSDERNNLSVEVNELKLQLRFKCDELLQTQSALKLKIEEERTGREQISTIMSQVEEMLEQEASESNKTITAIHDKMKHLKSRLSLELQQERRMTAVLQDELGTVRRDREEKSRDLRLNVDEVLILRDKLDFESQRGGVLQIKIQEAACALLA